VANALKAEKRALRPYCPVSEAFRCSADAGWEDGSPRSAKNLFAGIGTSYKYNDTPWWIETQQSQADPFLGLSEKPVAWVPDPSRFILLHEPPALPNDNAGPPATWTIWHYRRGPGSVQSPTKIKTKVVSPILFVDGHSTVHDFTKAVKSQWPAEPTANWIWYKPAK